MRRFLFFFLGFLAFSFHLLSQDNSPKVIEFTKKDLTRNPSSLSDVADRVSWLKLETVADALIGSASNYSCIQIPEGFIIYYGKERGKNDIMLFNKKGKFVSKIGRRGQGPQEYPDHYKVIYDQFNDQVLVFFLDHVQLYSSLGKYIKTVTIDKIDVLRMDQLMVFDNSYWMFTYAKPLDGELNEVGVLKTDREGRVIKRYNLTDKTSPGCYGNYPMLNLLYRSGESVLFSYFLNSKTLRLNSSDSWELAFILKSPIPEGPLDLFSRNSEDRQLDFMRDNGQILDLYVNPGTIQITLAMPEFLSFLISRKSGEMHLWGWNRDFKLLGIKDDIAGGPPFVIQYIDHNSNSADMIDAYKLLELRDKGLLGKVYKDKDAFQEMNNILDRTKPDDNPIIRIVHIK